MLIQIVDFYVKIKFRWKGNGRQKAQRDKNNVRKTPFI